MALEAESPASSSAVEPSATRARRQRALLIGIITVFFVFSVAAAWQLVEINGQLRNRAGENTLWALTQAQNHGSKLELIDAQYRLGLATREALEQQEDVFFSRLTLLEDGPLRRLLTHYGHDQAVLSAIDGFRTADTDSIANLPRDSDAHLHLAGLIDVLATAANAVMVSERDERGQQFDEFVNLIRVAFAAFSVAFVAGGLLVWKLLRSLSLRREQLRVIRAQHEQLQKTVNELHAAQHATETYRNFVSLVSHQFRSPLAVIDSTAQRLMRRARDAGTSGFAESQEWLDKMSLTRSTIESMNRLIDAVLTSVRLESGTTALQKEPMNLCELVGQVVAGHMSLLHERPLLLETEGAAEDYACLGDPSLLEHVLQNLLSNANKYTEPGTAIAVTLSHEARGTLVCTVRDWGGGVPMSELHCLFERFYRSSQSRPAQGTGLGLYLARSIARLHGGDLEASLPDGGGLVVHLKIPASRMRDSGTCGNSASS